MFLRSSALASQEYTRLRGQAELAQDRELVEVDALADDPVPVEDEEGRHAAAELAAGRRDPAQLAFVGPEQVELDDHRVVGVVEGDQLVALVGKRGARLGEVPTDLLLAVVDVARRDDLVARVPERLNRRI